MSLDIADRISKNQISKYERKTFDERESIA